MLVLVVAITVGGTLGILIPPSVMLVLMAPVTVRTFATLGVILAGFAASTEAATKLGYDMVWFACVVAVLRTAFLSPSAAMSAYYLKQALSRGFISSGSAGRAKSPETGSGWQAGSRRRR